MIRENGPSAELMVLINDKPLSGIEAIEINENLSGTSIGLKRIVVGHDELVNEMRTQPFTFKIINTDSSGYVADFAETTSFDMVVDSDQNVITQTFLIKVVSFLFSPDVRSIISKIQEEQDIENLINIIKDNQQKNKAILPTEEFVPKSKRKSKKK